MINLLKITITEGLGPWYNIFFSWMYLKGTNKIDVQLLIRKQLLVPLLANIPHPKTFLFPQAIEIIYQPIQVKYMSKTDRNSHFPHYCWPNKSWIVMNKFTSSILIMDSLEVNFDSNDKILFYFFVIWKLGLNGKNRFSVKSK